MKTRFLKALCALITVSICVAALAATPVTVTIDASKTGAKIPEDFVGLSCETKLMLPSDDGQHYFRPDNAALTAMFKQLNIKSLRIGGNSADNPAVAIPSEADIDSLFAFAKAADVKVIYTLRLKGQSDPAADAKIARYIWSKYQPSLLCFAIGNEPNIYVKTPEEYIEKMKTWMAAIGAEDVAPGAKFSGPGSTPGKTAWSREVAEAIGPSGKLALVTQHSYPGGGATKVTDPAAARADMLSQKWVAGYEKFADAFVPAAKKVQVPYRLEETNSYFYGGADKVSNAFSSSLWSLDFLYWWAEHDCAGINFHTGDSVAKGSKMTPSRYAVFWTSDDGYHVHPIGYGMKAFDIASHGTLIDAAIKSEGSPDITAYAMRADDGAIFVTLINKEVGEHASSANVTIAGVQEVKSAESMSLLAPQNDIAAMNGITLGGASIGDDGAFAGKWDHVDLDGHNIVIELPAGSAKIVKLLGR